MSKLEEILKEGRPPGFGGNTKAPDCADVAIPRALRQLEAKQDAKSIARGTGFSINQLKQAWSI